MGTEFKTQTADLELPLAPSGNLPVPFAPARPADARRRLPIIVTREGEYIYRLTILGELWVSVEWSASRSAWCVEDSRNRCLAHVDGIHGDRGSAAAAIRLAKEMIRSGEMPTPEEVARGGVTFVTESSERVGFRIFTKFAMLTTRIQWTPERQQQLRMLWGRGDTTATIAAEFGCRPSTISVARARFDLPPRREPPGRTPREPDEPAHKIERVAFTTSRTMEFCTEKE